MATQASVVPLQSKDHKTLMDIIDKLQSKGINRYVNLPQIVLNRKLHKKVNKILQPYKEGHPITYNHYLTENVQKIRVQRMQENIKRGLTEAKADPQSKKNLLTVKQCLDIIMKHTKEDMETVASSDIVNWMEAYYTVALKQIVDNFSNLAVESSLISKLPKLFTPEIVFDLKDDVVSRIAAESWQVADERKFLTDKIEVLGSGMTDLQRLRRHQRRVADDPEPSPGHTRDARAAPPPSPGPTNNSSARRTMPPEVVEPAVRPQSSVPQAEARVRSPAPPSPADSPATVPRIIKTATGKQKKPTRTSESTFNFIFPRQDSDSETEPEHATEPQSASIWGNATRPAFGNPTTIFDTPATVTPASNPFAKLADDASQVFQDQRAVSFK
ncbi:hypothetical protein GGR54DRAFT_644813 [Hypoxylon sp. NC1633]|nr:hypothetical protein GGR54DRAFT_644813 [Hypoxylon sp. NC1633]